jgi:hypothetical protein
MESRMLTDILDQIDNSLMHFGAELVLIIAILILITAGLVRKKNPKLIHVLAILLLMATLIPEVGQLSEPSSRRDSYSPECCVREIPLLII